jgi:hypothetical protein
MPQAPALPPDSDARRRRGVRTALALGAVAVAMYVLFMLTGNLAQ